MTYLTYLNYVTGSSATISACCVTPCIVQNHDEQKKNNPNIHTKNVTKSLLVLKSLLNLVASDESHFFLYGFIPNKHIIFTAQAGVHPYRMEVRRCSFTPRPSFFPAGQSATYFLTYKSATK